MLQNRSKVVLLSILVVCVLVLCFIAGVLRSSRFSGTEDVAVHPAEETSVAVAGASEEPVEDPGVLKRRVRKTQLDWNEEESKDSEVVRLQGFLDDLDDEAILAQAEFLSVSDSAVRRHASIAALQWLESPAAGQVLSTLTNDVNPEVASDARLALEHLFDSLQMRVTDSSEEGELVTEEGLDINDVFDMALAAIRSATHEDFCDTLMLKLSAMDVKLALPVYLEILESGESWQRDMAREYIDQVTNHDGVTNREEALLWLLKDQQIQ